MRLLQLVLVLLMGATTLSFAEEFARLYSDLNNSCRYHDTVLKPPLALKWRFFTEGTFKSGPVVFKGNLFAATRQGQIYCLNAETGDLRWKKYYFSNSESITPLAYGDYLYYHETGTSYNDKSGYFKCVRQDNGSEVWSRAGVGGAVTGRGKSSPLVWQGKVYYFGSTGSTGNTVTLYCFDAATGAVIWQKTYGPLTDAGGLSVSYLSLCTLTVKPVIISAYASNTQENWVDKYGQAFALTADSGRTVWETDVYHNVSCIYDTVLYAYTASVAIKGIVAASVFTGDTIYTRPGTPEYYKITPTDKYLFTRSYGDAATFINRLTGAKVGTADFGALPIPAGGKVLSGCGGVVITNGFGYCGFGHGGYANSAYDPPGGIPRGGRAQGIYAFEIPRNNETSLRVVWYYKMASNICSTPAIANGKLYYNTNQEGAIYCFGNAP